MIFIAVDGTGMRAGSWSGSSNHHIKNTADVKLKIVFGLFSMKPLFVQIASPPYHGIHVPADLNSGLREVAARIASSSRVCFLPSVTSGPPIRMDRPPPPTEASEDEMRVPESRPRPVLEVSWREGFSNETHPPGGGWVSLRVLARAGGHFLRLRAAKAASASTLSVPVVGSGTVPVSLKYT